MSVDLVSEYLVQQARALLRYKHTIDRRNGSTDGCTAGLVKQIDAALGVDEATHRLWISGRERWDDSSVDVDPSWLEESLLLQEVDQYEVTCCMSVEACKNPAFGDSLTSLDRQYLVAREVFMMAEKKLATSYQSSQHL